jgi:hypothetical protein
MGQSHGGPATGIGGALLALVVTACGTAGTGGATGATATGGTSGARASGGGVVSASWASALGPEVTIYGPGTAVAGHDSPQQAMVGYIAALNENDYKVVCSYMEPSQQAGCDAVMSYEAKGTGENAPAVYKITDFKLGYSAVYSGSEALVGSTGTVCVKSSGKNDCTTNNNPAAVLDGGHPFFLLWDNVGGGNGYYPRAVVAIEGKWYFDMNK